jgi:hypothetical protein
VQTNHLGGQHGKLRGPAITSASFRHEIPAIRVPLLAQSSQKSVNGRGSGFRSDHLGRCARRNDNSDPIHLALPLGEGANWSNQEAGGCAAQEASAILHPIILSSSRRTNSTPPRMSQRMIARVFEQNQWLL